MSNTTTNSKKKATTAKAQEPEVKEPAVEAIEQQCAPSQTRDIKEDDYVPSVEEWVEAGYKAENYPAQYVEARAKQEAKRVAIPAGHHVGPLGNPIKTRQLFPAQGGMLLKGVK